MSSNWLLNIEMCHPFIDPIDTGFDDEDEDATMLDGRSKKTKKKKKTKKEHLDYAAAFHTQVFVLLIRTWRTIWREKVIYYQLDCPSGDQVDISFCDWILLEMEINRLWGCKVKEY